MTAETDELTPEVVARRMKAVLRDEGYDCFVEVINGNVQVTAAPGDLEVPEDAVAAAFAISQAVGDPTRTAIERGLRQGLGRNRAQRRAS